MASGSAASDASDSISPFPAIPLGFLERRGVQDLPGIAFIPWALRVDLAHVALAGGIVEILVDQAGSRRDLADRKRGLPRLSSAAVKAFMCVISRVIRNCSASFVPGSSQKLIRRS